jgi:hypothetical protein
MAALARLYGRIPLIFAKFHVIQFLTVENPSISRVAASGNGLTFRLGHFFVSPVRRATGMFA